MKASMQCAVALLALCCHVAAGDGAAGTSEQPGPDAHAGLRTLQQQGGTAPAARGGVVSAQAAQKFAGKCITARVSVAGPVGPTDAQFLGPASQIGQASNNWDTAGYPCGPNTGPLVRLVFTGIYTDDAGRFNSRIARPDSSCVSGVVTFTWTSAWFRGCTLVPGTNSYPQTPTLTGPDAAGTVTVTVPALSAADAASPGNQPFTLTNCPATPPPSPGGCNGLNDGASCKWLPPDRHAWASPYMADASVGRLQRITTPSNASTAAAVMAARPASAGECLGRCTCGTCTISPEAATCCTSAAHAPSRKHAGYGDDHWYGHGGYGGGRYGGAYVQKTTAHGSSVTAATAAGATTTMAQAQHADYGGGGYGSDSADDGSSWTCWKYQQGPY